MKNKFLIFLTLTITGISNLWNTSAFAQDLPGKRDSIHSAILNQERIIQVVLPRDYKPGSAKTYDVLYVTDGDYNTKTISQVQQFIEDESFMPPTIIVGILNIDRNKDLTPTHVKDNRTSGGADKFLGFIQNELIPYVNKTYPSDGDNTLFGHSFGGLFVMYALLNQPQVFQSYIAADPSFWWDNRCMYKMAIDKLPGLANLNKTLYISGREGEAYSGMGIVGMDSILKIKAPERFTWKDQPYPDETHGSVRLKSMYDGLKYVYSGYSTKGPEFHPMNGTILKDKPIKIWCFSDTARLRYTTDGTEPGFNSAKMPREITLSGAAKLSVKQFSNTDRYSKIATGDFKTGTALPALLKVRNIKPGGFHYAYYEGQWDKLPDFAKLKPVRSGTTDSTFDINKLLRETNFALSINGWIEIKEEGYYVFGLASDDGSRFFLGNQLMLDNDGLHDNNSFKSYIIPLQKGFYPIRLEYFQKDGGKDLKLVYLTPSIMNSKNPISIPLNLQYSKE